MKTINFFAILILMLCASISIAQTTVRFSYDGAGNRIKREIVLVKSNETNKDSTSVTKPFTENLGELKITIYPNPTKGQLSVEITNLSLNEEGNITIHNLEGKQMQQLKSLETLNQLDLYSYPMGMYILRISVGQKTSEWKIIKE
jgi:YD repeat-containing protein